MPTVESAEKPKSKKEKPAYQKIPVGTVLGAPNEIARFLTEKIIPQLGELNATGCIVLIPTHRGPTKYAAIGNTRIDDGAVDTVRYLSNINNEIE